jgi:cytochrome c biogenesis protein CcmG/thiol:disulfide interchange protein DsbE
MTNRQQWTAVAGIGAATLVLALVVSVRSQIHPLGVGDRAPQFRAARLPGGRPVSLADYRGQVILLNVWATWCDPCRVEMPSMERLWRAFQGTGFRVVAVSIDQGDSTVVNAFVKELGLTFDILHDQPGKIQQIYQTTGVPESFVIDRDGVIVRKVIGASAWDAEVNQMLIRRLLGERQ